MENISFNDITWEFSEQAEKMHEEKKHDVICFDSDKKGSNKYNVRARLEEYYLDGRLIRTDICFFFGNRDSFIALNTGFYPIEDTDCIQVSCYIEKQDESGILPSLSLQMYKALSEYLANYAKETHRTLYHTIINMSQMLEQKWLKIFLPIVRGLGYKDMNYGWERVYHS